MNKSVKEKLEKLSSSFLDINKQFGKGTISTYGDNNVVSCDVISTGCFAVNEAMGVGGWPKGRIIELYGPEGSSKTSLALHAIAEAQKIGNVAAFVDAEHALDPIYAQSIGVNMEELIFTQPDSGEDALDITEKLIESGQVGLIVIDSVAGLVPIAELEGGMSDALMGAHARMMGKGVRKITGIAKKNNCCVIFINQLRSSMTSYGSPEVTPGGKALKFFASIRVDVRRIETLGDSKESTGIRIRTKIVKNKLAPPLRLAEYSVMYGKGIDKQDSLIDMAVKHNIIKKAGSWYSYCEVKLGQGKEKVKESFKKIEGLELEIGKKVYEKMNEPKEKVLIKEEEKNEKN